MRKFIIAATSLFFCALTFAGNYHVSKSGNDSNPGTPEAPFLTIQAAANVAHPGDVITVHEGIYRERVNPIRGGTSDSNRITYQAAEGDRVDIRGSEVITGWERFVGNTWKVSIPNHFFGDFNPYMDKISGDWFFPGDRYHLTGDVYLNGQSLHHMIRLEEVLNPKLRDDIAGSDFTWFSEADDAFTYIYANFHQYDPNKELVEINVRQTCFYPAETGVNYITLRGFHIAQAATPWAPPTAEQIGMVGTNWSKGWIIEDNTISHSRCAGITLGKDRASGHHVGDASDPRVPDGLRLYNEVVDKVIASGWSRELIGSHIVRNNVIFNCEQAGICGSLGPIFSTISNNHIYDIWVKKQFTGWEIAGIKIHGGIDMVIKNNHIHNAFKGIWLDWMTQGTRVSGNICYDNDHQDIFLEVNHGPILLDNNILLSEWGIRSLSAGTAFAHNLVAGRVTVGSDERTTPVFKPHSTEKIKLHTSPGGDERYFNNIFTGDGLDKYAGLELPVHINGNVYLNSAIPYQNEKNFLKKPSSDPGIKLESLDGALYLHITYDPGIFDLNKDLVTTDLMKRTVITNQLFETTHGDPIKIDHDILGVKRDTSNPLAGPFENVVPGANRIRIR